MLSLLILQVYILSQCHRYIFNSNWRHPLRLLWKLSYPFVACLGPRRRETKRIEISGESLEMSIEEKFHAGVKVIQSLPKDGPYQPSYSTKLKFYSLFKQASDGKCNIAKPAFWDVVGRAKWEAWNKVGDISKEEAMTQYVEELKKVVLGLEKIVETMSFNGDVQDFLDSIGPFYEFINLQGEELKHVKEQVDEYTSGSSNSGSSSNSTSAIGSPAHSVPNSPILTAHSSRVSSSVTNVDIETKENDTNEETITPKATIHANSNGHLPNQGESLLRNSDYANSPEDADFDQDSSSNSSTSSSRIPPPAPTHTLHKPIANGYAKCSAQVQDNEKNDEVLEIRHNHKENGRESEENVIEFTTSHQQLSGKMSADTVGSGADSDKYYSGDSEPEYDEKFVSYNGIGVLANTTMSSGYQSYSDDTHQNGKGQLFKTHSNGNYRRINEHIVTRNHTGSDRMTATSSSYLDIANRSTDSELVMHATVDRLNRDVEHILARLRILEAAYTANADGSMTDRKSLGTKKKRRIFGELSTPSLILIFTWPFAAHFLIKLITWWLRRRRRTRLLSLTN